MPIQSTDTTSTILFSADDQTWTIKSGVVVAPAASDAVGFGGHQGGVLVNYGDLSAGGFLGVNVDSDGDFIFNESGASITGATGIYNDAANDVITNLGTIQGTQNGIFADGSALTVYNSGYLFGAIDGVFVSGDGAAIVNNSGTIEGGSAGLYLGDLAISTTVMHNSGSLTGYSESIFANTNTDALLLTNTGSIHGTILLGGASDSIVNKGKIDGDIYLGNGSNSFTEQGAGSVTGAVNGGSGTDAFSFTAAGFNAGVTLNAGAGTDFLQFNTPGTIAASAFDNVSGIETITLANGTNNISLPDALVASAASHILTVTGGGGRDTIDGSDVTTTANRLHFKGGGGADTLIAGAGADRFSYSGASDSTGVHYDTVSQFNFAADQFNIPGNAGTITAIDAALTTGALSSSSFDANLTSAMNGHLGAHRAELFMPSSGSLSGQTFLVIDLNGTAGYQSGADLVIHLTAQTGALTVGDFI